MIAPPKDELEHTIDEVDDEKEKGVDVDGVDLPYIKVGSRCPQIVAAEAEYVFDPEDCPLHRGLRVGSEDGGHTLRILAISAFNYMENIKKLVSKLQPT